MTECQGECQGKSALYMLQNAMDSVLESQQQPGHRHSGHPGPGLVPPSQHQPGHPYPGLVPPALVPPSQHHGHHNSRTKKKKKNNKKKKNSPVRAESTIDGLPTAWSILQDGFGMGYKLVWIDQMTYQQLDTIKNNRECATIKDVIQLLLERYAWYGNNLKPQWQKPSMPQTSSMDVPIPPASHEDETKDETKDEKKLKDNNESCGGSLRKERKILADGSIKEYTYHQFRKSIQLHFLSQSHQLEFMDKMEIAKNWFKEICFTTIFTNVAFLDKVFDVYLQQTSYQSLANQETTIISNAENLGHDWDAVDREEIISSYTIKCLLDDLYWPGIVYADEEDLVEDDTEEKEWTFKLAEEEDETKNEMGVTDEEDNATGACRNEDDNDEDAALDPLQFGNSGSDVKLENGNPFLGSEGCGVTQGDQSPCVEMNSDSGDTNSDIESRRLFNTPSFYQFNQQHAPSGGRTGDTTKLSLDKSKETEDIKPHMLPSKLKCKVCGEIVSSHSEMKHHIAATHNDQQAPVPKRHTDQFVKEKMLGNIDSSQSLTDFEVSALSTVMRLCPVCNSYVPEYTVKGHMNKHGYGYGSKFIDVCCCNIRFRSREKLKIHKQSCDNHGNSEVICEICGKMCTDMSRLQKHRKLHASQRLYKKIKEYTCEICGKILRTSYSYANHKKIHLTVKPHQCPECGKGFSQPTNMRIHMRIHSGDKPYQCDMCTEAYAHNVSLKTHKKKVHGIDMWAVKSEETPS